MRLVDLSMTVAECDSAPFDKEEYYFKLRPIVRWEDKGFVSNMLPKVVYQIENLINLARIPSKVKVIAPPVKWTTESAPARVIALLDE